MSQPWFRLHHKIIDNERLKLISFEDRWHYIALLCLKADGLLDDPESELKTRRIAMKMGLDVGAYHEAIRRLKEVELVDADGHPTKWDEYQYRSDSSAERTRKYREKSKAKQAVTEVKRHNDGDVTPPDTDTDTDYKKDISNDISKKVRKNSRYDYSESFQKFWGLYPSKPSDPKPSAFDQFKKLTSDQQQSAINCLGQFKAEMEKVDHRPMQAVRFLRERVFENYEAQAKAESELPKQVFVAQHEDRWSLVADAFRERTGKLARPISNNGRWFDVDLVNSIAMEAAE